MKAENILLGVVVGTILLLLAFVGNFPSREPCEPEKEIIEMSYHNGTERVVTWKIRGHLYLVRGNEIVGRYDRFYTAEGEKR